MKILIVLMGLLFSGLSSFCQELTFEYDAAGNQTKRQWICINCTSAKAAVLATTKAEQLKQSAFEKDSLVNLISRKLIAYPNPLVETLYLKWEATDQSFLKAIQVFTMNGIKVHAQNLAVQERETAINFSNYVPGIYLVRALYSDNRQEVIKVIKR